MTLKQLGAERIRREIIRLCQAGFDARTLRIETMKQLRKALPIDVSFFATVDPATLLFTDVTADDILAKATPRFIENEFLQDDLNKFTWLASGVQPVSSLVQMTDQRLEHSRRYREILAPLGLGDELRAALIARDVCWGFLCLHRDQSSPPFTPAEAAFLQRLTPHLAEGLRRALLLGAAVAAPFLDDAPGLLLLADDLSVAAITPAAERLLADLAESDRLPIHGLPHAVYAAAARLQARERDSERDSEGAPELLPKVRLRTAAGQWLILHASRSAGANTEGRIAVIFEVARPVEIAQLIVQAYALSHRESEIVQLVAQGQPTTQIAATFHITSNTVQDHLKAIFDKVGVRSRRELVSQLFAQHYQPHIAADHRPGADGWFN
jgi:DNA-binding CsgD family transcriptional regulator/GAF domain-containing protein